MCTIRESVQLVINTFHNFVSGGKYGKIRNSHQPAVGELAAVTVFDQVDSI